MSMKEAISLSLYSYWNALRGTRPAPKRFEIEPSRIATNLPDTFILERINPANTRFRLAGSRIVETLGMELRGKNIFDMFGVEDAITLRTRMEVITSHCAVGLFRMSADGGAVQTAMFELLIMPLIHTGDTVERFLGCIVPIDSSTWLGTVPLGNFKLTDDEVIWPDGRVSANAGRIDYQSPVLPMRRAARIVRSDRRQFRVYEGGLSGSVEER
ncbi:MAG: PAS domain-containing protein [Proteobacteria bacterium]|nr:PAS domain-containing protein [Pseudomonadota bacterium]